MTTERPVRAEWAAIDDEVCRRASGIVEFVGRRWTSGILLALARGAARFSEIEAMVQGLSARMLATRLRELGRAGLVDRIVEPTTPVTIRYHLTSRGQELIASLRALVSYGQRWESDGEMTHTRLRG